MKRQPRLTRREQRAKEAAKLPSDGVLVSCERAIDGWYIVFTKPSGEESGRFGPFTSAEDAREGLEEVAKRTGTQLCESLAEAQKRN